MGRHGALPSFVGEAHEANQTPHRAVLLSTMIAFIPVGLLTLRGSDGFEIFGLAGTTATFGFITAYMLVSAAAPIYLRAQGRLTVSGIAISIAAIVAMGGALLGSLYPVPPPPYSWLPYLYLTLLMCGLIWFVILSVRSPQLAGEIRSDLGHP